MSISRTKKQLIAWYNLLNSLPREQPADGGAWLKEPIVIPQIVLDADDHDVFASGFTIDENGNAGSAPLHKCGCTDEKGKFIRESYIPYTGFLEDGITIIPGEPKNDD